MIITFFFFFPPNSLSFTWDDHTKPQPTTPTNTQPWPTPRPPSQTWPTNPLAWPPTMSPYPTKQTGDKPKNKLTAGVIAAIVASSVVGVSLIVFLAVILIRRFKKSRKGKFSILVSLSEPDLSKKDI